MTSSDVSKIAAHGKRIQISRLCIPKVNLLDCIHLIVVNPERKWKSIPFSVQSSELNSKAQLLRQLASCQPLFSTTYPGHLQSPY